MNNIEQIFNNIKKNQKPFLIGFGVVFSIIAIVAYLFMYYMPERENEAQGQLALSQFLFEKGDYNAALKGGGQSKGLEYIKDNYSYTKASKLATYYAGVSYLQLGQYDKSIENLKGYSTDLKELQALAYFNLANAYSESKKMDEALSNYEKAAKETMNPVLGAKLAFIAVKAHLADKKPEKALELIDYMETTFPNSQEAQLAQVFKASADAQLAK